MSADVALSPPGASASEHAARPHIPGNVMSMIIGIEFARGLAGMVDTPVSVSDLERTREEMIAEAVGGMPEEHRRFLVSFETGAPNWSLLAVAGARRLPAVRWRMMNVARLDAARRAAHAARLERTLAGTQRRS